MKTSLIYPQLVGKRIQKVEVGDYGNVVFLHTATHILRLENNGPVGIYHRLDERSVSPEPLVIPAKK